MVDGSFDIKQEALDAFEASAEVREEQQVQPAGVKRLKLSEYRQLDRHTSEVPVIVERRPLLPVMRQCRDPRLNRQMQLAAAEENNGTEASRYNEKRKAFLEGQLMADDLIRTMDKNADQQSETMKRMKKKVTNAQNLLSTQKNSFYANVAHEVPSSSQFVSPLVASNHNGLFLSQATASNVFEAVAATRHQNVPQSLQDVGTTLGINLSRISQELKPVTATVESNPGDISFISNSRSVGFQTDVPEDTKDTKDSEVQTTENVEGFSIFIADTRLLTGDQRRALLDFKKAMNCRDEISTSALLNRIMHRQARDKRPAVSASLMPSTSTASAPVSKYSRNAVPK